MTRPVTNCEHTHRPHAAHGLCKLCYNKAYKALNRKPAKKRGRPLGSKDANRRPAGTCPHPDRPVRAQKMCGPCYVTDMREGRIARICVPTWEIIEDMEVAGLWFSDVLDAYNLTQEALTDRLTHAGRKDLIPVE